MSKQTRPNAHAVEWDPQGMVLGDDPHALLALPEGLLALEGLPVMFHGAAGYPVTQDKVLAAAEHIIAQRTPEQAQQRFHNQAQVMAFASREFGWHTGKDLSFASIPNYMQLPKDDEATKQAKAEELDAVIVLLNSGLLTTREGTRKLFPDKDVDAIWDRHEAEKKAAVAKQKEQMAETLAQIEKKRAERGETPPTGETQTAGAEKDTWADSVEKNREQSRRGKPNPCLGF